MSAHTVQLLQLAVQATRSWGLIFTLIAVAMVVTLIGVLSLIRARRTR